MHTRLSNHDYGCVHHMLMLMVRATGVREDSVQTTLHMETILLLNAERFGKQRGATAGDLPDQMVSPSKFLVSLIVNNSSVN